MRNKSRLAGTSNDGFRHRYFIDREKGFRDKFLELMEFMGFNSEEEMKNGRSPLRSYFYQRYSSDSEDEHIQAEWTIDADEISDELWEFRNEEYFVEVFFGEKKIIVVIETKKRKKSC